MLISRKMTKDKRVVTDFRHLNMWIAKNNLAYPLLKDTFSMLGSSKCEVMSVLDLKDAFHSLRLTENSKKFCGILPYFGSPSYLYQRMPMGLNISPPIWQSYINAILNCLQNRKYCEAIMDDLLLFTPSKASHFEKSNSTSKMSVLTIASCLFVFVYDCSAVDIMPKLKKHILNFGYGVNFKYEGMLSHSFDRFYIVTKFELPRTKDLKLATFGFDFECSYANHTSTSTSDYVRLMNYCMKIVLYAQLYQRQIQYYNKTAYDTLANDIGKILPKFPTDSETKCGAILTTILESVASKVIGIAYEGISSFLHHKRHKALHKAVAVMNKRSNVQRNQIHHLENSMIMYGVYNSDTLKDLMDTVHRMQNFTTWNEKTFAGKLHDWMELYLRDEGECNYAINSILFLTTIQEKYVRMYERFIEELKLYSGAIRVLSKGNLPISLLPPSKLEKILSEVRIAIEKSNKDYDLVLTRLYLYYNMKLVTFGIDNQRNLIVQFPVFIHHIPRKD